MKYNEAIDMILDGGEAYRKSSPEYKETFRWWDNLCGHYLSKLYGASWNYGFIIDKEAFTATDWIVEKDGVVYEEYKALHKALVAAGPIELSPTLTINLDEYIDKKIECMIRRVFQSDLRGAAIFRMSDCDNCHNKACQFCFPEEVK